MPLQVRLLQRTVRLRNQEVQERSLLPPRELQVRRQVLHQEVRLQRRRLQIHHRMLQTQARLQEVPPPLLRQEMRLWHQGMQSPQGLRLLQVILDNITIPSFPYHAAPRNASVA